MLVNINKFIVISMLRTYLPTKGSGLKRQINENLEIERRSKKKQCESSLSHCSITLL